MDLAVDDADTREREELARHLKRLVEHGFEGAPVTGAEGIEALVYRRGWTSAVLDVVVVVDRRDVDALRTSGVNPLDPSTLGQGTVQWRQSGTVVDIVAAMLALDAPAGGFPIRTSGQPVLTASSCGELWTP
ncbi:hypothetical protein LZ318_30945 [Saccharopolyspora indica]|uniref:hypothetical protein n=1 Tax=Saccharopolyspora indica TaxID=1229659 RepID=UPI0022EA9CB7|nr:hypothetical protein [Saccharopolyspora indica]MDA3644349.1 hypothetical protein [Saccharopolyspora indica]